ncbi:hypothetical protein BJX99DRAFT_188585 [Aspergillus californicus]
MNATVSQGWQFNDNSRSSWDILWTCLTTIFACTWTVLHPSVPGRNRSKARHVASKLTAWFLTVLAPEGLVLGASEQFWRVWSLTKRCNAAHAQTTTQQTNAEPSSWLYNRTKPLASAQAVGTLDLYPPATHWTLSRCWCVEMVGLALVTEDGWEFYVLRDQIVRFIEIGIITCSDFTDQEIQDRVRTDAFTKGFTIAQSAWVLVDIIARAGYSLPITPFEFATLSYILCAIMTYACYWHKPQGMTIPITLPLRYTRDALPLEIRSLTDEHPKRWLHRHLIPPREPISAALRLSGRTLQTNAIDQPLRGTLTRESRGLTLQEEWLLNDFAGFAGIAFCGIHVAAWNFAFPTHAEAIAWRVLSLTALGMVVIIYAYGQVPLMLRWLNDRSFPLPLSLRKVADPRGRFTPQEVYVQVFCMLVYALARVGLAALMFSSFRALPSGAYLAVDWLGSIPHI